jgi:lysophospholipase L1-like esterase
MFARRRRPSGARRARLRGRALLLVATGVLALCAIELAFRALGLYGPHRMFVQPAGAALPDVQTDWEVVYRTNSLGLRGPLRSVARREPGELSLVAIGDSYVFGQGVELADSFPALLETRLRERGRPAQVVNVSNIGISSEAYYVLLRDVGLRYRPDLVVLTLFGNDASLAAPPTRARRLVRGLSHHSHLVTLQRIAHRELAKRRQAAVVAEVEGYWDHVARACTPHHGAAACRAMIAGFRERHGSRVNNLATACLTDPDEVRRWVETDLAGPGWDELEFYVEAMARLCERRGCRLVLGIVPDGAQVDAGQLELRRSLGVRYSGDVLTAPGAFQSAVAGLARRLGVGCYDPLDRFRSDPGGLYFDTDLHWTPAGHRAYAEGLLEFLEREGELSRP